MIMEGLGERAGETSKQKSDERVGAIDEQAVGARLLASKRASGIVR